MLKLFPDLLVFLVSYLHFTYLDLLAEHELDEFGERCPQLSDDLHDIPVLLLAAADAHIDLEAIARLQQRPLVVEDVLGHKTDAGALAEAVVMHQRGLGLVAGQIEPQMGVVAVVLGQEEGDLLGEVLNQGGEAGAAAVREAARLLLLLVVTQLPGKARLN